MADSQKVPDGVVETVLKATLNELGGEPLDGSGFEEESSVDLDDEAPQEEEQ